MDGWIGIGKTRDLLKTCSLVRAMEGGKAFLPPSSRSGCSPALFSLHLEPNSHYVITASVDERTDRRTDRGRKEGRKEGAGGLGKYQNGETDRERERMKDIVVCVRVRLSASCLRSEDCPCPR